MHRSDEPSFVLDGLDAGVPRWEQTQVNLGTALGMLGERESGTAHLEQAVAAFRELYRSAPAGPDASRIESSRQRADTVLARLPLRVRRAPVSS
jgi:hypothetical protein